MLNNKKYIIAISNTMESGKTHVIKALDLKINTLGQYINNNLGASHDIITEFDYTNPNNKKTAKIGIISYGDGVYLLAKYLNKFLQDGCDIIICACRTTKNAGTYKLVNNFSPYIPFIFNNLGISENQTALNKATVENIFNNATATEIENLINMLVV